MISALGNTARWSVLEQPEDVIGMEVRDQDRLDRFGIDTAAFMFAIILPETKTDLD